LSKSLSYNVCNCGFNFGIEGTSWPTYIPHKNPKIKKNILGSFIFLKYSIYGAGGISPVNNGAASSSVGFSAKVGGA
jgi:hypothetical protein